MVDALVDHSANQALLAAELVGARRLGVDVQVLRTLP
jgi:hypothetical protein